MSRSDSLCTELASANERSFAASLRLPPPRVTMQSASTVLASDTISRTSDSSVWGVIPILVLASFGPNAFCRSDTWVVFLDSEAEAIR